MALGPFLAASESFLLKDDKELHSSPCATEDTVYTTEVVHKPFKINTVVPIVKGPDSAKTVVDKDTDDEPKPQKLRFQDDMYTPEWVRYAGPLKQGLCEQCTPPKWLQLRNSAYWYHKLFFHGISATTGKPFTSPQNVRIVWTIGPNKPGEQVCHVYLHVEGYCFNCCKYLVLNKTRRRSVGTADPKQMRQKLTTLPPGCPPDAGPRVLSEDPLTITATVTMHGSIYVPPPLCVNEQMEAELLDIHKNQQQMTVWYRHAYKCHPQEQSSKPKSDKRRKKSVDVVIKNNNLR
ncbi:hypothetical protein EDD86DRAFT_194151 [Gorgonomyces haynaldii]|nr:hypothetical protein EDD86DRAFT_194151 [Gorgonomyces haynaldii]